MAVLMGIYHQGGVIETQLGIPQIISQAISTSQTQSPPSTGRSLLSGDTSSTAIFWWKTYPPPLHLLGHGPYNINTKDQVNVTTEALMGLSVQGLEERLASAVGPCNPSTSAGFLQDPSLDSALPLKLDKYQANFFVCPLSALPRLYSHSGTDKTWSERRGLDWALSPQSQGEGDWEIFGTLVGIHRNHINLDDLDFPEDGVLGTFNRVIGSRGLGVWHVQQRCRTVEEKAGH